MGRQNIKFSWMKSWRISDIELLKHQTNFENVSFVVWFIST